MNTTIHDARDIVDLCDGSIEEELSPALLQMRTEAVVGVDAALARLEAGKYGVYFECEAEIAESRLRALPFAIRCRRCGEGLELEHGLRRHGHGPSVHVVPSLRRQDAPALSSPAKPSDGRWRPSTNHLNPTGTSIRRRVEPGAGDLRARVRRGPEEVRPRYATGGAVRPARPFRLTTIPSTRPAAAPRHAATVCANNNF